MPERRQAPGALAQRELERRNRRQLAAQAEHFDGIGAVAVQAAALAERILEDDRDRRRDVGRER